jgi:hypothetical protein
MEGGSMGCDKKSAKKPVAKAKKSK